MITFYVIRSYISIYTPSQKNRGQFCGNILDPHTLIVFNVNYVWEKETAQIYKVGQYIEGSTNTLTPCRRRK